MSARVGGDDDVFDIGLVVVVVEREIGDEELLGVDRVVEG